MRHLLGILFRLAWPIYPKSYGKIHITAYIWISELGQPLQSYFELYRQFTITKAAEEFDIEWKTTFQQIYLILLKKQKVWTSCS